MRRYSAKERAGVVLFDLPRLLWALRNRDGWERYGNRGDRLSPAPAGPGTACDWEYSRTLHISDVFPRTGYWLFRRALQSCPIRLAEQPAHGTAAGEPDVSFIIGHRGKERLPHLLWTIRSLAGQTGVRVECVVVEQDIEPAVAASLPDWVRRVHSPPPDPAMPYARAWAFNVGAREARGRLLVFHDNDMLLPAEAARLAWERFRAGWEVIQLKRFVFYRSAPAPEEQNPADLRGNWTLEYVCENLAAGGSLAVSRTAFEAIGGFDERFIGWGGEDDEFWDRCRTRKVWPYGCLPVVHLGHESQEGKREVNGMGRFTADLTRKRRALDPLVRIRELRSRRRGELAGPAAGPGEAAS